MVMVMVGFIVHVVYEIHYMLKRKRKKKYLEFETHTSSVRKSSPVWFFGLKIGNRQLQQARTSLDQFKPGMVENKRKRLKTGENGRKRQFL